MSKIKNIMRRCQSFPKLVRSYSNLTSNRSYSNLSSFRDPFYGNVTEGDEVISTDFAKKRRSNLVPAEVYKVHEVPKGCRTVYVGKGRRRYFISEEYLNNPLLRALIAERFRDGLSIACEVVMFEHLVWMLENADPEAIQSDLCLEELAQFYTSN